MLSFECDYLAGAHPRIMEKLLETNLVPQPGYGADAYTASAREKVLRAAGCPEGDVHFLVGGTQTNRTVISSLLKIYQGVVACDTGHVNGHEAGAIEAGGHKVLTIPGEMGKLPADRLRGYLQDFYADEAHDHLVFPGMVYISFPTEYGTVYTKEELLALRAVCDEYDIPLFVDGARLGYGLMSRENTLTLPELAELVDVFTIGGTKVGALCGEAVVFPKGSPDHFMTMVKQHGALLAKGRLLGVQFDTLFTDDLYFEISRHAIDMAELLKQVFTEKGYEFFLRTPTNQQFFVLENSRMAALKEKVRFEYWEKADDTHTVVRFATSWATEEADIAALKTLL